MDWLPPQEEIATIPAGTVYVHVTTVTNWPVNQQEIKRKKGYINALGRGFYTYPKNVVDSDKSIFTTFISWAKLDWDPETKQEMKKALQDVRIVEVSPKTDVKVWEPQGTLPVPKSLDEKLTTLSKQDQLKFLAITEPSKSKETVWLNAVWLNDKGIARYPVEDETTIEYLKTTVRPMTEQETNTYVNSIF
jgi:hypothetical protein